MTTWKHGSFEWLQIDFSDPPTWHKGKAVRINQVTGKRARNQGVRSGWVASSTPAPHSRRALSSWKERSKRNRPKTAKCSLR